MVDSKMLGESSVTVNGLIICMHFSDLLFLR